MYAGTRTHRDDARARGRAGGARDAELLLNGSKLPRMPAVRTSKTDPLHVNWVKAPEGHSIGITIGPGKKTSSLEGAPWDRDVATDCDQLCADGVDVLVCLLETHEMARLSNADLLVAARERGIDALHFPIVDVTAPSKELANEAVAAMLARKEKKIVIHCNGGLGRSGVIAGCLLRALGVSWEETQERLHAARGKRCPETVDQRRFIEKFAYVPA